MKAILRALRRFQLRADIETFEQAIAEERKRHAEFEARIIAWNFAIRRREAELAELAPLPTKSAQPLLSGLRRVK